MVRRLWLAVALATVAWACGGSGAAGQADAGDATGVDDAGAGEGPETETVLPPYDEPAARVLFDLQASPVEAPFPYDYYLGPDGSLRLDEDARSSAMLPLVYTITTYRDAFAAARGFATYAPVAFTTTVPVDPTSLPADGASSVLPDASVQFHRLGPGDVPVARVAFRSLAHEFDDGVHMVMLYPMQPLDPDSRYAVAVTDRLRAADGTPVGMSGGFARIKGVAPIDPGLPRADLVEAERARLAPMLAALPDADRVVAAVDFSTGHVLDETERLFRPLLAGPDQVRIPWDLDLDDDGRPDAVPGPDFADCRDKDGSIAYGIAGTFQPLNYTAPDPDRHFHPRAGGFETFPQEPIGLWLTVPAGTGPFPVVVLGHGIGPDHGQLCSLSRELAAAGLASVRFDWPRHGQRGEGAMDFLTLPDPLGILANFRQAAVDLGSAVVAIEDFAKVLDVLPLGAPDGKPDLDGEKVGYAGHSLGGIIAMLYLPFSDRVRVAVINEASVGLFHLVGSYLFRSINLFGPMSYVFASPHLLWGGDGASFAHAVVRAPFQWAGGPHHVLAQELIGDTTIPNEATEALARAVGLKLVEPVAVPIDGVESVPAAGATSGLCQWDVPGSDHSDFTGHPDMPHVREMRDQAIEYLRSGLYEGVPRIVHGGGSGAR